MDHLIPERAPERSPGFSECFKLATSGKKKKKSLPGRERGRKASAGGASKPGVCQHLGPASPASTGAFCEEQEQGLILAGRALPEEVGGLPVSRPHFPYAGVFVGIARLLIKGSVCAFGGGPLAPTVILSRVSPALPPPVESIRLPPKSRAALVSPPGGETTPRRCSSGLTCQPPVPPCDRGLAAPGPASRGKSAKMNRKLTLWERSTSRETRGALCHGLGLSEPVPNHPVGCFNFI